jgi:hypothetical protein
MSKTAGHPRAGMAGDLDGLPRSRGGMHLRFGNSVCAVRGRGSGCAGRWPCRGSVSASRISRRHDRQRYFGERRYKYTPGKKTPTSDAYNQFTTASSSPSLRFGVPAVLFVQRRQGAGDLQPSRHGARGRHEAVLPAQRYPGAHVGLQPVCRFDEEARSLQPVRTVWRLA